MNRVLIFAGAQESKLLIKKISEDYLNLAEFHIIYTDDEIKDSFSEKENLIFYKIDFFAFEAYREILRNDFDKVVIIIKNRREAEFVLKKAKNYATPVLYTKFWIQGEIPDSNNIEIIDVPEITTNKIIDFLPNVPLYARDIGLGEGEILEVEIPPHSPFTYKTVSIFDRHGIRVGAIYRNHELKEFNENTLILPNDKIILIGPPQKLTEIFTQIKTNVGAFPQPYGQNIYLLIDMKNMEQREISKLLKTALHLHRKLKNRKLIIKIINPSITSRIYKLFKFDTIDIYTDYYINEYKTALKKDTDTLNIGLIITNNNFFYKYKKTFFNIKKPLLKVGYESIKKCEGLGIILNDKFITRIAPVIFDLSFQLNIKVTFYNVDPENSHKNEIEYLTKLAKNFNFSNVEFVNAKKTNPVFLLQNKKNICLVEAFTKIPPSKIRQILFPSVENSYTMLNKFNQFLIPIKDENESNS